MDFVLEMLRQGWALLRADGYLGGYVTSTLRLAFWSTAIALVLGLPLACWIATGASRARRTVGALANAGLGLPPVGVGVYLFMMGPREYYGTFRGMVLAQTVLSLPIIVALCAAALRRVPAGLVEQARVLGAHPSRIGVFMVREAKVGVIAAVIVAVGAAVGEVGAVTIMHGSATSNADQTLAMQILWDRNHRADGVAWAVAHTIVILALVVILGALLTLVQQSHRWAGRWRLPAWRGTRDRVAALLPERAGPRRRWPAWLLVVAALTVVIALVGDAYRWQSPTTNERWRDAFFDGFSYALQRVESGGIWQVTRWSLELAFQATAIGVLIGVPLGCLFALGRFRGARLLLTLANGVTRVPPVAVGVVVVLLFTRASQWGGGPLADVPSDTPLLNPAVAAQTLLALPLMTVLTAAAVQSVAPGLLDQARALGAPWWRCAVLALREAKRGVFAAVIASLGVTIAAVGALAVAPAERGGGWTTLSLSALQATSTDYVPGTRPNPLSVAVAMATIMFVLFAILAAILTWLQRDAPLRHLSS